MFVLVRMQLSNHVATQPVKAFQALQRLCDVYTIFYLECCKCARMRFHCANGLVLLRICAVAHVKGNTGPRAIYMFENI